MSNPAAAHFAAVRTLAVIFLLFLASANAAVRNVATYGAAGNGTVDDTSAIRRAISQLAPDDTLLFPCGTYLITSQLIISTSKVTIDGKGCATVHSVAAGNGSILAVGGSGNSAPAFGPPMALAKPAAELSTSFETSGQLAVHPGDYIYIHQGGRDYSTDEPPGHDANCDISGCRGEVLRVQSVRGNIVTVSTALHDAYDPWMNAAVVQKLLKPVAGITIKNITFESAQELQRGLGMNGVVDSQVLGVTARNVQGAAVYCSGCFNVALANVTVSHAGSTACGSAVNVYAAGNLSLTAIEISSENPGKSSGCLGNGAFGLGFSTVANSTLMNVSVDASGAYGRPFKTTAARWNTFNRITVRNGATYNNGISLEYYSSHNTFNQCVVMNNGAGTGVGTGNAGINSFGNFNQYNTFRQCVVAGNGNVQFYSGSSDALRLGKDIGIAIQGGIYTGTNDVEPVILITGAGASVTSAVINGHGSGALELDAADACVSKNTVTGMFRSGSIVGVNLTSEDENGNDSRPGAGSCPPASAASHP